jgi:hypothetical protein
VGGYGASRTPRLRRSTSLTCEESSLDSAAVPASTLRSGTRGGQLAYEVAQLNKKRDKLEDKVKKLERKLNEERGQWECDMALLRQSHKNNISDYTQRIQQLESELSQSKKMADRLKEQLEKKDVQKDLTVARMAQLEEETVQLKSRLERHGSMKRRKDMFEQKAMELEKENLRLHSQLARELHRVKTEVDSRIVVQHEKLKIQSQLEEEMENAEKLRDRVNRLERENDGMAKSLEANRTQSDARISRLEADLTDQRNLVGRYRQGSVEREQHESMMKQKDEEVSKLTHEVQRLHLELERVKNRFSAAERDTGSHQSHHLDSYPPRGERCRSLSDVSSIDSGMISGGSGTIMSELRSKVAQLQMYAGKAYQSKAAAEQQLLDSEHEWEKQKSKYKDEIHFLRQMNIKLASDEAKESNLIRVLSLIKQAKENENMPGKCDALESQVEELQHKLKTKESKIAYLEYQLLDKEAVVASLVSELDRHNVELDQTARQLRRRPEYHSASSVHSHLTTPTLCDSRQSLFQCDSVQSPTDQDTLTESEKIGRSASAGPSLQWPMKQQPLRRTNSEGSSPVFGYGNARLMRQPFYSVQSHMTVALEAQAVARGLAELMQSGSGESLDQAVSENGSPNAVSNGQPREGHPVNVKALDFRPLAAPNWPNSNFRRVLSDRNMHGQQSGSSDAFHVRQSSGDSELSMPPSPGSSSCNTRITRSSASYCSSPEPDYYESYPPKDIQISTVGVRGNAHLEFNGIPTRPVPIKPGSRSPVPQRPLSPRLRANYFQSLAWQSVSSESDDEAGSTSDIKSGHQGHLKQRSGSLESLKTDLSVSTSAVRGLHARLEQVQRIIGRHHEQMSVSGDSSVLELTHPAGKRPSGDSESVCEDPEERERLGSSTNYRLVPLHYKKQSIRSASVGSLDNLRATRC